MDFTMRNEDILARLEKHEAECNLRYKRIEERQNEFLTSLKSVGNKLWGVIIIIIGMPFFQAFIG